MTQLSIKKILIPTDFSDNSLKAFDHAILLAKITKAEVVLLHVMEDMMATAHIGNNMSPSLMALQNLEGNVLEYRKEQLNEIIAKLEKENVPKVTPMVVIGRTHREIINALKNTEADIVFMGTHGVSGFREFIMGSNTASVVRDAPCPVLSVQKQPVKSGFKNILVPFSDRPHSREKVMYAIKMAELYGATLHILGIDVENSPEHTKTIELEAAQIKEIIDNHQLQCTVKVMSAAYDFDTALSYAAKVNADLIVEMGDIEKQNIAEYFSGSFSQQIINHSTIPVLSIHSSFNPEMVEQWHGI